MRGVAGYNDTHGFVDMLDVRHGPGLGWVFAVTAIVGELAPRTRASFHEHYWSRKVQRGGRASTGFWRTCAITDKTIPIDNFHMLDKVLGG